MLEFTVVNKYVDLSTLQAKPDSIERVSPIFYSETAQEELLIARKRPSSPTQDPYLNSILSSRIVWHWKTKDPYWVQKLAWRITLGEKHAELGVWYIGLYPSEKLYPHWFRPLHTPNGKGWLDPVENGGPRFLDEKP